MKRKTNLFYTSESQDSAFITFSNYTESLTGNIMSTDNKIYPSTFICLQLDSLYDSNKAEEYYNEIENENKQKNGYVDTLETTIYRWWLTNDTQDYDNSVIYQDENGKVYSKGVELDKDFWESDLGKVFANWNYGDVMIDEYQYVDGNLQKIKTEIYNLDHEGTIDGASVQHYRPGLPKPSSDIIINRVYTHKKKTFDKDDANNVYSINKQRLIDELVCKYENKLATLRDWCVDNDINQETTLLPLNYLLETISNFEGKKPTELNIPCIGDVTEQDWNGTFSDTICVIDTSKYKTGSITSDDTLVTVSTSNLNESKTYLHGWYVTKSNYNPELDFDEDGAITLSVTDNETVPNALYEYLLEGQTPDYIQEFKRTHNISTTDTDDFNTYFTYFIPQNEEDMSKYTGTLDAIIEAAKLEEVWKGPSSAEFLTPVFDTSDNNYTYTSSLSKIEYDWNNDENTSLKFNVVIPLFDLVDMNYEMNSTKVEQTTYMTLQPISTPKETMVKNVPHGIWFSGYNPVILNADKNTNTWPSWSLALASQFKPFPSSTYMPSEITSDSKKLAFSTFAQVLSRQNEIYDQFEKINNNLSYMSNRLTDLESKIGAVLTSYNLDNFRQDIANYKTEINSQVNSLVEKIDDLDLKWVNREG